MPRARRTRKPARKKSGFYAWTDIHNGGETKEVRGRTLVVDRNMVKLGDPVSQDDLGVTDEEWDHLLEGGSIRDYPLPEGIGENESPSAYVTRMQAERQELDPDTLLKMNAALEVPAPQPTEEAEVEEPPTTEEAHEAIAADVPPGEASDK
jgi:hypothetical protein